MSCPDENFTPIGFGFEKNEQYVRSASVFTISDTPISHHARLDEIGARREPDISRATLFEADVTPGVELEHQLRDGPLARTPHVLLKHAQLFSLIKTKLEGSAG